MRAIEEEEEEEEARPNYPHQRHQQFVPLYIEDSMTAIKTQDGFVQTPAWLAKKMVENLFANRLPKGKDTVLDPGCGEGDFINEIILFCRERDLTIPAIIGVELDSSRAKAAKDRFRDVQEITILEADYLRSKDLPQVDFVIGNPPYVSLTKIAPDDRVFFKKRFNVATYRFDLYMLFFERSIELLKRSGRLAFVTPEKWLNVGSAQQLRSLISNHYIERLDFIDEGAFPGFVTYPLVTQIVNTPISKTTKVSFRNGISKDIQLSRNQAEWPPLRADFEETRNPDQGVPLAQLCSRIGIGPASGLDRAFIVEDANLPAELEKFAFPTLSGKELNGVLEPIPKNSFLIPYNRQGKLLAEDQLGPLLNWLSSERKLLEARSCAKRKPWYAFHENPSMPHLLQPKILCRDITEEPTFYIDRDGSIIPRHSVYYIIPKAGVSLDELHAELCSEGSRAWLKAYSQRAANGYLRIQSKLLKQLPIQLELPVHEEMTLFN